MAYLVRKKHRDDIASLEMIISSDDFELIKKIDDLGITFDSR